MSNPRLKYRILERRFHDGAWFTPQQRGTFFGWRPFIDPLTDGPVGFLTMGQAADFLTKVELARHPPSTLHIHTNPFGLGRDVNKT